MRPFVHLAQALAVPRRLQVARGGSRKIYAITGPNRRVVYVGVTSRKLSDRLAFHLERPTNSGMAAWFEALDRAGSRPEIHLLENVAADEWEDAERGWIFWFRQRGHLLNVDRGGLARDKTGRLRSFRPGEYQPPSGSRKRTPKSEEPATPLTVLSMPHNPDLERGHEARDRFFRAAAFVPRARRFVEPHESPDGRADG